MAAAVTTPIRHGAVVADLNNPAHMSALPETLFAHDPKHQSFFFLRCEMHSLGDPHSIKRHLSSNFRPVLLSFLLFVDIHFFVWRMRDKRAVRAPWCDNMRAHECQGLFLVAELPYPTLLPAHIAPTRSQLCNRNFILIISWETGGNLFERKLALH